MTTPTYVTDQSPSYSTRLRHKILCFYPGLVMRFVFLTVFTHTTFLGNVGLQSATVPASFRLCKFAAFVRCLLQIAVVTGAKMVCQTPQKQWK